MVVQLVYYSDDGLWDIQLYLTVRKNEKKPSILHTRHELLMQVYYLGYEKTNGAGLECSFSACYQLHAQQKMGFQEYYRRLVRYIRLSERHDDIFQYQTRVIQLCPVF